MKETQQSIKQWADETFGPPDPPPSTRKYLRLLEEVIELCLAAGAKASDFYDTVERTLDQSDAWGSNPKPNPDKIPGEIADCGIVLLYLSEMNDVNFSDEIDVKMRINRNRRWTKTGGGCGQHIEEKV